MATGLTDRQRDILNFIRGFIAEAGYSPSLRDIMEGAGVSSTSVVSYNLQRLRDHQLIDFDYYRSRSVRLINGPPPPMAIPHAGWLTQSAPMPSPEAIPDWPTVTITPTQLMGALQADAFAVHVQGWWLVESGRGIADGDMLIVSRGERELEPDADYITWNSPTQQTEIVRGRDLGETRTISARLRALVRVMVASG